MTYFYNLRNNVALPVEKPVHELIWTQEMNDYLVECTAKAVATNALNLQLGMYEGQSGAHGDFQRIVTGLFNDGFPEFTENQVSFCEKEVLICVCQQRSFRSSVKFPFYGPEELFHDLGSLRYRLCEIDSSTS